MVTIADLQPEGKPLFLTIVTATITIYNTITYNLVNSLRVLQPVLISTKLRKGESILVVSLFPVLTVTRLQSFSRNQSRCRSAHSILTGALVVLAWVKHSRPSTTRSLLQPGLLLQRSMPGEQFVLSSIRIHTSLDRTSACLSLSQRTLATISRLCLQARWTFHNLSRFSETPPIVKLVCQ